MHSKATETTWVHENTLMENIRSRLLDRSINMGIKWIIILLKHDILMSSMFTVGHKNEHRISSKLVTLPVFSDMLVISDLATNSLGLKLTIGAESLLF